MFVWQAVRIYMYVRIHCDVREESKDKNNHYMFLVNFSKNWMKFLVIALKSDYCIRHRRNQHIMIWRLCLRSCLSHKQKKIYDLHVVSSDMIGNVLYIKCSFFAICEQLFIYLALKIAFNSAEIWKWAIQADNKW